MSDLANYLLDHYGTCDLEGDDCLHIGNNAQPWIGRLCPHWTPLGATTWQQLREFHERERYGAQ